jgi:hypothetical protein
MALSPVHSTRYYDDDVGNQVIRVSLRNSTLNILTVEGL